MGGWGGGGGQRDPGPKFLLPKNTFYKVLIINQLKKLSNLPPSSSNPSNTMHSAIKRNVYRHQTHYIPPSNQCTLLLPPVDCTGGWQFTGRCSQSCGVGVQALTFQVYAKGTPGGALCEAADGATQQILCNIHECRMRNLHCIVLAFLLVSIVVFCRRMLLCDYLLFLTAVWLIGSFDCFCLALLPFLYSLRNLHGLCILREAASIDARPRFEDMCRACVPAI